jgi:hypothetical protein
MPAHGQRAIDRAGEFFSRRTNVSVLLLSNETLFAKIELKSNESAPAGDGNRFSPAKNVSNPT